MVFLEAARSVFREGNQVNYAQEQFPFTKSSCTIPYRSPVISSVTNRGTYCKTAGGSLLPKDVVVDKRAVKVEVIEESATVKRSAPRTREEERLYAPFKDVVPPWRKWGPYVSERSWGSVREDYSPDGAAWDYLTHDKARSKAYRWGEDGIAGISDRYQLLCFAMSFWNGKDPILKERMFGLTSSEGNHGEDVKEYYFYLDNTPTHSYMKILYKYPQREFPYRQLIEQNRRRDGRGTEYELLDTGVFDDNRYFDIFIEYAKAG